MNFLDRFYESLKNYLINKKGIDVQEVTSYEEDLYLEGYCETCYYETMTVIVYYNDSSGFSRSYRIKSQLSDLMKELI